MYYYFIPLLPSYAMFKNTNEAVFNRDLKSYHDGKKKTKSAIQYTKYIYNEAIV